MLSIISCLKVYRCSHMVFTTSNKWQRIFHLIRTYNSLPYLTKRSCYNNQHHMLWNRSTLVSFRTFSTQQQQRTWSKYTMSANRNTVTYITAVAVTVLGLSYAAVPLYRIFCQASGYGGAVNIADPSEKVENMEPVRERELTIRSASLSHIQSHYTYIILSLIPRPPSCENKKGGTWKRGYISLWTESMI